MKQDKEQKALKANLDWVTLIRPGAFTEFCQTFKEEWTMLHNLFQKIQGGTTLLFCETDMIRIPKPVQRQWAQTHTHTRTTTHQHSPWIQTHITWQNISKHNSAIYKMNNTPRLSGAYCRDTRLVQRLKIKECNPPRGKASWSCQLMHKKWKKKFQCLFMINKNSQHVRNRGELPQSHKEHVKKTYN